MLVYGALTFHTSGASLELASHRRALKRAKDLVWEVGYESLIGGIFWQFLFLQQNEKT